MSTSASPYGLRPSFHRSGAVNTTAVPGGIASGYNTNLYEGSPLVLGSGTGKFTLAASGSGQIIDAVFAGVRYVDSSGQIQIRNRWVAGTTGTQIEVLVYADPLIVYSVQADGPVAQTALGGETVMSVGSGVASSGMSTDSLTTAGFVAAGGAGSLKVIGLVQDVDNAWGDAFTSVRVILARPAGYTAGVAV